MNYFDLLNKIEKYREKFNVRVIGESFFKRKIFAVEKIVNKNFFTAIFVCSIHAREFVATDVVCKMIDYGLFDGFSKFNVSFIKPQMI